MHTNIILIILHVPCSTHKKLLTHDLNTLKTQNSSTLYAECINHLSYKVYGTAMIFSLVIGLRSLPTPQRNWVQSSRWSPSVCQQKAVCPLWPWWTPLGFLGPSLHTAPGRHSGIIQLLTTTRTQIHTDVRLNILKNTNSCTQVHQKLEKVSFNEHMPFGECFYPNGPTLTYLWWKSFPTLSVLVPCTELHMKSNSNHYFPLLDLHGEWSHKNSNPVHCHLTTVECSLSTHGEQDAIWTLCLDDLRYKLWRDGQEIDGVSLLGAHLVGLNRGYVWIHEHCLQVLLLQHHIGVNSLWFTHITHTLNRMCNTFFSKGLCILHWCWLTRGYKIRLDASTVCSGVMTKICGLEVRCCVIPYLHGLDCLRSRVVKLSSLTDRQTTRTQYEHLGHLHLHK